MPGRKFDAGSLYRYGFNGKENDNEVKGEGNQQDYGLRIYNPRIGKFLSLDPLSQNYPMLTPYQFASNRPIDGIDLDGAEFLQYLSKNQYSVSLYRLNTYEKVVSNYKLATHIWVTDAAIHKVIMNHPDNKPQPLQMDDDSTPKIEQYEGMPKNTRKHRWQNNKRATWANERMAPDIVGGLVDLIVFVNKVAYQQINKKEMAYGQVSLQALDEADKLMRAASKSKGFPEDLSDPYVQQALVNYMTDGFVAGDNINNQQIIRTWGNLILENRDVITDLKYDFSLEVTVLKPSQSGSGNTGINRTVEYKEGNPDPKLKAAHELLKQRFEKPNATISEN